MYHNCLKDQTEKGDLTKCFNFKTETSTKLKIELCLF